MRLLILITGLLLLLPAQAALAGASCFGSHATIVGTSGSDDLVGTAARDVIFAGGGADTIHALKGNDVVCAGRGDDLILGGSGSRDEAGTTFSPGTS